MVRKTMHIFGVRWGGMGYNEGQEKEGRALSISLVP